jgi:hypothetical protein
MSSPSQALGSWVQIALEEICVYVVLCTSGVDRLIPRPRSPMPRLVKINISISKERSTFHISVTSGLMLKGTNVE